MARPLSRLRFLQSAAGFMAAGGAVLGAACGPLRPATEAPRTKVIGKVTAQFITNDLIDGPRYVNDTVIAGFEKQFPGIKIEPLMDVAGPLFKRFTAEMVAGTGPDLWHHDDLAMLPNAAKGWVKDRSDLIKRDAKALAPIAGLLNIYRDPEGKLYGPPSNLFCTALVYNKVIFDRLGLKYPDENLTWNPRDGGTFLELARKLTRPAEETWGWWHTDDNSDTLSFLKQNNGSWLDKSMTKADMLKPESLQAFEFMGDLINRYQIAPKRLDAPQIDNTRGGRHWLFLRGNAAMFNIFLGHESAWAQSTYDESVGLVKLGTTVLPKGARRASGSISQLWYLRADLKDPEPAWEFVKWWYNDLESQIGVWTIWKYGLPPSRKAWSDPRVLQPRANRPLDIKAFIDAFEKAYAAPYEANVVWGDYFNAFRAQFRKALDGELPMKIAIEQAQRDVQGVLDTKLPKK